MSVLNSVFLFLYRLRRFLAYALSFILLVWGISMSIGIGLFAFEVDPQNVGIALFIGIGGTLASYLLSRMVLNVLLIMNDLWVVVEWETVEDEE